LASIEIRDKLATLLQAVTGIIYEDTHVTRDAWPSGWTPAIRAALRQGLPGGASSA
jgi:hypothetical protein